jgi:uncharacterized membrane protein
MTDAHLHLVVNHFPIIGTIFGLGILIAGMLKHNISIKNTAYCLFIVSAITAFLSMYTGEGAEHMVKDMPDIGMKVIHEHEDWAEKLASVLYLLGVISIAGIVAHRRNFYQSKLVAFMALTVAIVAVILAKSVGTSGGEIRHTEIRENVISNSNSKK